MLPSSPVTPLIKKISMYQLQESVWKNGCKLRLESIGPKTVNYTHSNNQYPRYTTQKL